MTSDKTPLDYASSRKDRGRIPHGCIVAVALVGLLPLFLGSRWLHVFVFTDYREHHRPIMIPLGLATTLLGAAMIALPFAVTRKR